MTGTSHIETLVVMHKNKSIKKVKLDAWTFFNENRNRCIHGIFCFNLVIHFIVL